MLYIESRLYYMGHYLVSSTFVRFHHPVREWSSFHHNSAVLLYIANLVSSVTNYTGSYLKAIDHDLAPKLYCMPNTELSVYVPTGVWLTRLAPELQFLQTARIRQPLRAHPEASNIPTRFDFRISRLHYDNQFHQLYISTAILRGSTELTTP